MEVVASAKFVRISPKKVRPLLKDLRGKKVTDVLAALHYSGSKAGKLLYKLIASASANASNNYNLKQENLKIKTVTANDGPRFKRIWMRSRGSSDVILKRTAHLAVVLEEIVPTIIDKPSKPAVMKKKTQPQKLATESKKPLTDQSKATRNDEESQLKEPQSKDEIQSSSTSDDKLIPRTDTAEFKKHRRFDLRRIFRRTTNK